MIQSESPHRKRRGFKVEESLSARLRSLYPMRFQGKSQYTRNPNASEARPQAAALTSGGSSLASSHGRLAVVAIGGNSLIKDKQHKTVPDQYAAAQETCAHIAGMIAQGWNVAIGHGNGPQVGFILRRSELARHELHEVPLDFCGADSQGAIGYMLQQILHNEFRRRGIQKRAVTVVTQVLVDRNDPAFQNPSKPIGSFMDEAQAMHRAEEEGWKVVEDAGRGWRRVVPSPLPKHVIERDAVKDLLDAGFIVITVGGGGIPVVEDEEGNLAGTAAVIDKDFASSLLAQSIGADLFLISTAVEKVSLNFGQPNQVDLAQMTVAEAKQYIEEGHFAPGSMLPKIQAIVWFLEEGGKEAIITNPENIERALAGETGTRLVP
jgi:carbamate kinase